MRKITFNQSASLIVCDFYSDESEELLKIKASGKCNKGSEGSQDINKIFFLASAHFFLLEPSAILFDLSDFEYEFSNTLLKILNFTEVIGRDEIEREIPLSFILSKNNEVGISSLLGIENGEFPDNFFKDEHSAMNYLMNKLDEAELE